jgi:hypothetical protein
VFKTTVEDISTFTIAGAQAAKMSATSTRLTWTNVFRYDEAYCYKDYTANHFDLAVGFTHDYTQNIVDWDDSPGGTISTLMQTYVLANAVNDLEALKTGNENFISISFEPILAGGVTRSRMALIEWANNARSNDDFSTYDLFAKNTDVYVRVVTSGSSVVAGFYSTSGGRDAGDGTDGDLDNLAITLDSATLKFRYLYVAMSRDRYGRKSSGYVENLELNEGAVKPSSGNVAILLKSIGVMVKNLNKVMPPLIPRGLM